MISFRLQYPRRWLLVLLPFVVAGILFLCRWEQLRPTDLVTTPSGNVVACCVAPLSRYSGFRSTILLYNESLECLRKISTDDRINCMALSDDGARLIAVSRSDRQETFRVWDVATGRLVQSRLLRTAESISAVRFTPDGQSALFVRKSSDVTIRCQLVQLSEGTILDSTPYLDVEFSREASFPTSTNFAVCGLVEGVPRLSVFEFSDNRIWRNWSVDLVGAPYSLSVIGTTVEGDYVVRNRFGYTNIITIFGKQDGERANLLDREEGVFAARNGFLFSSLRDDNRRRLTRQPLVPGTGLAALEELTLGGRAVLQGADRVLVYPEYSIREDSICQVNFKTRITTIAHFQAVTRSRVGWLAAAVSVSAGFCAGLLLLDGAASSWRWRPLVDLLLIQGVLIGAVGLRIVWGETHDGIESAALAGAIAGYLFLASLWLVLGPGRVVQKFSWVIGILAMWSGALLLVPNVQLFRLSGNIIVTGASLVVTSALVLLSLRRRGRRLLHPMRDRERDRRAAQITILDILLLMAATGLLVTLAPLAGWWNDDLATMLWSVVVGFVPMLCGLAAVWLVFGDRWLVTRIVPAVGILIVAHAVVVYGVAYIVGYSTELDYHLKSFSHFIGWDTCMVATMLVVVVSSLAVLQVHGFTLTRRSTTDDRLVGGAPGPD